MLMTQFEQPAGTLHELRWGWWHIACFTDAYNAEGHEPGTLRELTEYTFTQHHHFEDPSDGEVLEINPGDLFRWWRD